MEGKQPIFGNIGNFLEKFKNFTSTDLHTKKISAEILSTELGIEILKADLSVQKNTLRVQCSPIIKQEIRLRKQKIIKAINQRIGKTVITEIQ